MRKLTVIFGSFLLLAACSGVDRWEESSFRWKPSVRQAWTYAAQFVDSSNVSIVPADPKALLSLQEASAKGDPFAQWQLAVAYDRGAGDVKDEEVQQLFNTTFESFKKLADQKDPEAMYMLAQYYEEWSRYRAKKSPATEDLAKAFSLNLEAAEMGFAPAQNAVGTAYVLGEGVEKDENKGLEWKVKAASQGDVEMQDSLGSYYCSGFSCEKELDAVKWYEMAAKQGHRQAQRRLAKMYADEKRVLLYNPSKAFEWYSACAMLGDPECIGEIWWAYQYGKGAVTNNYKAYVWLLVDKAINTNEPFMYEFRVEELTESLSSSQMSQAQAEAEQLFDSIKKNKEAYSYVF